MSFSWAGGEVELRSGEAAIVPLPTRSLELALGQSSWALGCADGCGEDWWAGWAEAP